MVRSHFRPEFLNRLDDIILFHRLKRSEMGAIVEIQLKRLQKLLDDRKITLDLDEAARHWLAEKGYDPVYGARPLKRVIQREVQDPLADKILAGEIPDGSTVKVTGGTDKLLFLPRVAGGRRRRRRRSGGDPTKGPGKSRAFFFTVTSQHQGRGRYPVSSASLAQCLLQTL